MLRVVTWGPVMRYLRWMSIYLWLVLHTVWRVKLTVAIILGAAAGAIFAPAWSLCRTLCPRSASCSTHPHCGACVHLNWLGSVGGFVTVSGWLLSAVIRRCLGCPHAARPMMRGLLPLAWCQCQQAIMQLPPSLGIVASMWDTFLVLFVDSCVLEVHLRIKHLVLAFFIRPVTQQSFHSVPTCSVLMLVAGSLVQFFRLPNSWLFSDLCCSYKEQGLHLLHQFKHNHGQ